MSKLIKQRKESIKCYSDAKRDELVAQEQEEVDVITSYMPVQLTEAEGAVHDNSLLTSVLIPQIRLCTCTY